MCCNGKSEVFCCPCECEQNILDLIKSVWICIDKLTIAACESESPIDKACAITNQRGSVWIVDKTDDKEGEVFVTKEMIFVASDLTCCNAANLTDGDEWNNASRKETSGDEEEDEEEEEGEEEEEDIGR